MSGQEFAKIESYDKASLVYRRGDRIKFEQFKRKIENCNPDHRKDKILKVFMEIKRHLDAKCILP